MTLPVVETSVGCLRPRRIAPEISDPEDWLFQCPGCGTWAYLDSDQWNGRVSVDHAADGCSGGYHETHDFAAALRDALNPGDGDA